jgi:hypothetical protein
MNGNALAIIRDAAVFRGELKRDLLAFGIVMLIALIVWVIQAYREGRAK